jgi:hypothetical protein
MKNLSSAILLFLAIAAIPVPAGIAQDSSSKLKVKADKTVLRDKSKPVRRALEAQYAKLAEAIRNKDLQAFHALRTDDFSTSSLRAEPQTTRQMADRARLLLEQIQPPIDVCFIMDTISLRGNEAVATIHQRFSRMQMVAGQLRKLETCVTQDETWIQTTDGWKLKYVENERDLMWFVDGKRIEPGKPYDPNAPEYNPDASPKRN